MFPESPGARDVRRAETGEGIGRLIRATNDAEIGRRIRGVGRFSEGGSHLPTWIKPDQKWCDGTLASERADKERRFPNRQPARARSAKSSTRSRAAPAACQKCVWPLRSNGLGDSEIAAPWAVLAQFEKLGLGLFENAEAQRRRERRVTARKKLCVLCGFASLRSKKNRELFETEPLPLGRICPTRSSGLPPPLLNMRFPVPRLQFSYPKVSLHVRGAQ